MLNFIAYIINGDAIFLRDVIYMCCFFNSNCCNKPNRDAVNRVYITGPQGPRGPIGPQGPTGATGAVGPQGADGVSATNNALYSAATGATVAADGTASLVSVTSTENSDITVSNGVINVPVGYYLVNYSFDGTSAVDAATVNLTVNDAVTSAITYNAATSRTNVTRSVIINATVASVIAIKNGGTGALDGDFYVTVVKLA